MSSVVRVDNSLEPDMSVIAREVREAAGTDTSDGRSQSLNHTLLVLQFNRDGTHSRRELRRIDLLHEARRPAKEMQDFLVQHWSAFEEARRLQTATAKRAARRRKTQRSASPDRASPRDPTSTPRELPSASTGMLAGSGIFPGGSPLHVSATHGPVAEIPSLSRLTSTSDVFAAEVAAAGSGSGSARRQPTTARRAASAAGRGGRQSARGSDGGLEVGAGGPAPGDGGSGAAVHPEARFSTGDSWATAGAGARGRGGGLDGALRNAALGTLQWRDVRKLDHRFSRSQEPILLVRRHAIVFSMSTVKALVLHDRCFFVVPEGADSILGVLMRKLRKPMSDEGLPFELYAVEALLITLLMVLRSELKSIRPQVEASLEALQGATRVRDLEELRMRKQALDQLSTQVERIQRELADSVDSNAAELARMRLTLQLGVQRTRQRAWLEAARSAGARLQPSASSSRQTSARPADADEPASARDVVLAEGSSVPAAQGEPGAGAETAAGGSGIQQPGPGTAGARVSGVTDASPAQSPVVGEGDAIALEQLPGYVEIEDIELLLESYLEEVEEVATSIQLMCKDIASAESLIMLRMSDARNRLLKTELWFSVVQVVLAPCMLLSGIYGMNLKNGVESEDGWFNAILAGIGIFIVVSILTLAGIIKRLGFLDG